MLYYFAVIGRGPGIVIVHPAGQDVELLCTVMTSNVNKQVAWTINHGTPYTVSGLRNGIVAGYSVNKTTNNLIVENIMMNDGRNNTEYRCVIKRRGYSFYWATILQSDPTILYVAGEYQCMRMYLFYPRNKCHNLVNKHLFC